MILYVHIPFCISKCGYCAFNSTDSLQLHEKYMKALSSDLKAQLNFQELSSIYFGGGTPNILHQRFYEDIFKIIQENATLSIDCEITMECNPNLVNLSWCESMRDLGVNRVSLGVQSFFEEKLNFLQRDHHCYDILKSIEILRKSGINYLSIDLIYNTPMDHAKLLEKEVARIKELHLDHLSTYALSIDQGSKFYKNPPDLSEVDYSFLLRDLLSSAGFNQYEVSSYAFTHKSHHNLAYWRGEDYLGCGAGGVGCIKGVRMQGSKHIPSYIQNPLKKQKEFLSVENQKLERLFLGLRCEVGVEVNQVSQSKVEILLQEGKCRIENNRLIANDFFLADEIALWLS